MGIAHPGAGPLASVLSMLLRGAGQVIFLDNPWTGLLHLAAFCWATWAGGSGWEVALGAVLGTAASTVTARMLRVPPEALRAGLYGFNGLLVGAGVATFLAPVPAPEMWALLVLAAALSTPVALLLGRALARWRLPGLTMPFIVCTWLALLAARHVLGLEPAPARPLPEVRVAWSAAQLLPATLAGVAQIFFIDNPVSGALVLLGLALHSRACALLTLAGAAIGTACALAAGAPGVAVAHGLWGYSAALVAPAVGCVFRAPGRRSLALALGAVLLALALQAVLPGLLQVVDLPPLTLTFVLATWVFLLPPRPATPA